MKTRIISAITVVLAVAGAVAPVALAKDNSTRPVQSVRAEIKDLRTEFRSDLASKSAELKRTISASLANAKKLRLQKWWDKAVTRLQKLIDHEKNLLTRAQKRIEKLAAAGGNVEKARAQVIVVQNAINDAQKALDDAKAQAPAIIRGTGTPSEIFAKLHQLHKGVVGKIRIANKELVTLIKMLKTIPTLTNPDHTPTPSATPTPTATP